jgi:hypothetical protein
MRGPAKKVSLGFSDRKRANLLYNIENLSTMKRVSSNVTEAKARPRLRKARTQCSPWSQGVKQFKDSNDDSLMPVPRYRGLS